MYNNFKRSCDVHCAMQCQCNGGYIVASWRLEQNLHRELKVILNSKCCWRHGQNVGRINTDTISHIQELNWYEPNNALITTSLLSPGSAQVDSRSGRSTSFSPWAEWRHGRRGSMRQPLLGRQCRTPDREKHPRASGAPPEDHNPRIFGPWPGHYQCKSRLKL